MYFGFKHLFMLLFPFLLLGEPSIVFAQETNTDYAWKHILEHEGVTISYIFYSSNEGRRADGVVLRLVNTNTYAVSYQFVVVFRSDKEVHEEEVIGELDALEIQTGESEGLFWMPFADGKSIIELGLKGYKIRQKSQDDHGF